MNVIYQIAQDMRNQLGTANGSAERVHKSTYLALLRRDHHMQLCIGRRDAPPAYSDAIPVADAFDVPAGTDPVKTIIRVASQDGRSIPVQCLKFAWTEIQ